MEKDVFQRLFLKKKEEEDFPKKFKKFKFFHMVIEPGALAHCNVSLSLHQKARSSRVWSDRACGAVRPKNESVCQWRDALVHPLMKCASPIQ